MSLSAIGVTQFKCFSALDLSLRPLTLLTGFNAAGKSSSLQPLLLLAQAARGATRQNVLDLNGPLTRLGTSSEILHQSSTDRLISFDLVGASGDRVSWRLEATDAVGARALEVKSVTIQQSGGDSLTPLQSVVLPREIGELEVGLALKSIIYLGALRTGPLEAFPTPDGTAVHSDVGIMGEYAPWWYAQNADEEIAVLRRHPDEEGLTLRRQLDAYFSDLFPGAQANAEAISKMALTRLNFRTSDRSDWLRPSNVGFGLTYAFSLIVAVLLARSGQIVMIDSPEAHLHPLGQSLVGRLLAIGAAAGLQLLVETHSDHVLNGIRLAVRDGVIKPEEVAIHYFNNNIGMDCSNITVTSPRVGRDGSLDTWPPGFFDQADIDLTRLTGLG